MNKWWILFATTCATALIFLENTLLPVALPSIQLELGLSGKAMLWVMNLYLLTLSSLLLCGGRLTEILGSRRVFLSGLALFGGGSLLCAYGDTLLFFLGRVGQGMGSALLLPATGALLVAAFPERERGKALGINTGISSLFLIVGPVVGGMITQYFSWRYLFLLKVPLVVCGGMWGFFILPREEMKKESFHLKGAVAAIGGLTLLVVGCMQANTWGWDSYKTWGLLCLAPVSLHQFRKFSQRHPMPLIDMHLFKNKVFLRACTFIFLVQLVVMATVFWGVYLQQVLIFTPAQTGFLIFFSTIPVLVMAPLGGYLRDKQGLHKVLLLGFGNLVFALAWILCMVNKISIAWLLPGLITFGTGVALIMSPAVAEAFTGVSRERLGTASALTLVVRQLGATVGMAVFSALYEGEWGFYVVTCVALALALLGTFLVIRTGWQDGQDKNNNPSWPS